MTLSNGSSHVNVEINILYDKNQEAYIDIIDNVKEAIDAFPRKMCKQSKLPGRNAFV